LQPIKLGFLRADKRGIGSRVLGQPGEQLFSRARPFLQRRDLLLPLLAGCDKLPDQLAQRRGIQADAEQPLAFVSRRENQRVVKDLRQLDPVLDEIVDACDPQLDLGELLRKAADLLSGQSGEHDHGIDTVGAQELELLTERRRWITHRDARRPGRTRIGNPDHPEPQTQPGSDLARDRGVARQSREVGNQTTVARQLTWTLRTEQILGLNHHQRRQLLPGVLDKVRFEPPLRLLARWQRFRLVAQTARIEEKAALGRLLYQRSNPGDVTQRSRGTATRLGGVAHPRRHQQLDRLGRHRLSDRRRCHRGRGRCLARDAASRRKSDGAKEPK
jgi:hypothetical protein